MHGQLQRIQQAQHATSPGAKDIHRPCSVLNSINEDLHWIMLVAGISIMVFDEDDTLEYLGTRHFFTIDGSTFSCTFVDPKVIMLGVAN